METSLLVVALALVPSPLSGVAAPRALRRHAAPLAAFSDFAVFEREVREYLSALDEAALNDAEAPSPLAYLELQSNGRADLAEGCMQYGGYLAVSSKLGVRVQRKALPPPSAPIDANFGKTVVADQGATLSAAAKEDRMAADLARMRTAAAEPPTGTVDAASGSRQAALTPGDRLTPLRAASPTADGMGAFATKNLKPGDTIASIPRSCVLTARVARQSALGKAARKLAVKLGGKLAAWYRRGLQQAVRSRSKIASEWRRWHRRWWWRPGRGWGWGRIWRWWACYAVARRDNQRMERNHEPEPISGRRQHRARADPVPAV